MVPILPILSPALSYAVAPVSRSSESLPIISDSLGRRIVLLVTLRVALARRDRRTGAAHRVHLRKCHPSGAVISGAPGPEVARNGCASMCWRPRAGHRPGHRQRPPIRPPTRIQERALCYCRRMPRPRVHDLDQLLDAAERLAAESGAAAVTV